MRWVQNGSEFTFDSARACVVLFNNYLNRCRWQRKEVRRMAEEQINMDVSLKVTGKEGYDVSFKFVNTRMEVVVLMESLLIELQSKMLQATSEGLLKKFET